MRTHFTLARALVVTAVVSGTAGAQDDDPTRRSISASIGAGVTSAGISCVPDCGSERKSGPTYLVRVAGHISQQFALGIEATAYSASVQNASGPGNWTLSWIMLGAQWYPNPESDFFIKAGVGVSTSKADLSFPAFGTTSLTTNVRLNTSDYGAIFGLGRDFFVTERFALTPYAAYLFSPRSQATINQANSGARLSSDIIVLGLAVSIP